MRIAIAALVVLGVAWFGVAPVHAVPLTGTASHTLVEATGLQAIDVAKRSRKKVRRSTTRKCGWQCKRYYRPFQYRYWKFYYPYGGPLFYGRR
ncbi:MAG: hypothetical protein QNJ62_00235 [Methyloceanibacter sp.]|nr:hypothetical protein [Methyloceanibacter sp.]